MVLWDEVAVKVSKEFPDVKWDKMLVDVMTVKMMNKPKSLDTIVGTNLHMDILTDLAAALVESIGVAPSSNLDQTRKNPNLFEPVHGSAFNITREGLRIRWLLLGVQLRCWGGLGGKRRRGN
jgi:isocitrate/isopropylmalate dehydrogenase